MDAGVDVSYPGTRDEMGFQEMVIARSKGGPPKRVIPAEIPSPNNWEDLWKNCSSEQNLRLISDATRAIREISAVIRKFEKQHEF